VTGPVAGGAVAIGDAVTPLRIDGVESGPMKTMAALLRDPNPIHFDPAVTRALGMGEGTVNQGPTNVGWVASALMAWGGGGAACLRRLTVRLTGNVLSGDVVEAGGVVEALAEAPEGTVATCRVWLRRSDGVDLVAGTAEVLLPA